MWFKKKSDVVEEHVETAAEYWAKRDAARAAQQAQVDKSDGDDYWDGYAAPPR